jgi:hypothetical protein
MGRWSKTDMTQDEYYDQIARDCINGVDLLKGKFNKKAISEGLLIKDYPVKWRQARELAVKEKEVRWSKTPVFRIACKFFLELGGGVKQPLEGAAADVHFSSAPSKRAVSK